MKGLFVAGLIDERKYVASESIETLIELAKEGDVDAFQRVYGFFVRRLFSFVQRMLNSPAEAEEVVQETFITVFQKLSSLNDVRKFEPWLFRIARNLVYMRYRQRSNEPSSFETEEDLEEQLESVATARASPEEEVMEGERRREAEKAIRALPDKMRDIFLLSVFHGFSYQQIGEITGRSLAAVKSDLHRARLIVREYLNERFQYDLKNEDEM